MRTTDEHGLCDCPTCREPAAAVTADRASYGDRMPCLGCSKLTTRTTTDAVGRVRAVCDACRPALTATIQRAAMRLGTVS